MTELKSLVWTVNVKAEIHAVWIKLVYVDDVHEYFYIITEQILYLEVVQLLSQLISHCTIQWWNDQMIFVVHNTLVPLAVYGYFEKNADSDNCITGICK